jgi:hypothetical protein
MVSYEIISEKMRRDRVYQLAKFSRSKLSRRGRKDIFQRLLREVDTIGIIEWWAHGSITRKPWNDFYVIVIRERA